jgi:hypothetical protein
MIFLKDTAEFRTHPGDGKCSEKVGSWYGNFPAGILLPCSGYISGRFHRVPAWKRQEFPGKIAVSCRILRDPVAGSFDLGHYIL